MKIPRTLKKLVGEGRIVPVTGLGIGLSVRRKNGSPLLPTWRDFLYKAVERLEEELRSDAARILRLQLDGTPNFADAFRTAHNALGHLWPDFLKEQYDPERKDVKDESLALAQAVWRLSNGLVISIAHDQVLEWASSEWPTLIGPSAVPKKLQSIPNQQGIATLCHLYGTVTGGDAIFTIDGVRTLVPDYTHTQRLVHSRDALMSLFAGPNVALFVGTSIPRELGSGFYGEAKVTHYWLVLESHLDSALRFIAQADLPIQPVGFPSYSELPAFVEELAGYRTKSSGLVSTEIMQPQKGKGSTMASTKKTLNILFLDLSGWSKMNAAQITTYLEKALPKLDSKIKTFHSEHLNTWGDAVVATFGSAADAANCALDIRDLFRRATETDGVPRGLVPRISLHVGEVIVAFNPLIGRDDIFGDAVHLAARLEPVTERGQVFCTEAFAKSLDGVAGTAPVAHAFTEVELPKGFGKIKVFSVTGPNEDPPNVQTAR